MGVGGGGRYWGKGLREGSNDGGRALWVCSHGNKEIPTIYPSFLPVTPMIDLIFDEICACNTVLASQKRAKKWTGYCHFP